MRSKRRSKTLIAREELRRALEGILDLERLLSRVTLETANPRDVLALAASLATAFRRCARRWRTSPPSALQTAARVQSTNSPICAQRIEQTIVPEPPISLSDGGVIAAASIANSTSCAT